MHRTLPAHLAHLTSTFRNQSLCERIAAKAPAKGRILHQGSTFLTWYAPPLPPPASCIAKIWSDPTIDGESVHEDIYFACSHSFTVLHRTLVLPCLNHRFCQYASTESICTISWAVDHTRYSHHCDNHCPVFCCRQLQPWHCLIRLLFGRTCCRRHYVQDIAPQHLRCLGRPSCSRVWLFWYSRLVPAASSTNL